MTIATATTPDVFRAIVARRIDASPAEVFDAWAEPDRFARWFENHRAILRRAAVDELWFWEAEHQQRIHPHYCRYTRVERPGLLEFTWVSEHTHGLESLVTLELTPIGGGTELTLTHGGLPDDEQVRSHRQGWTSFLDKLAAKIGGLR